MRFLGEDWRLYVVYEMGFIRIGVGILVILSLEVPIMYIFLFSFLNVCYRGKHKWELVTFYRNQNEIVRFAPTSIFHFLAIYPFWLHSNLLFYQIINLRFIDNEFICSDNFLFYPWYTKWFISQGRTTTQIACGRKFFWLIFMLILSKEVIDNMVSEIRKFSVNWTMLVRA